MFGVVREHPKSEVVVEVIVTSIDPDGDGVLNFDLVELHAFGEQ